ncbi:MAG: hypothetical protein KA515_03070 [Candidatus Pacebacteria bacterium]|nr:hypothetical protein [Candidatus Paceibacterota bacterium]
MINESYPKSIMSKQEAALQLLQERKFESFQTLFEEIKQIDSVYAIKLKPDFDQFMEIARDLMALDLRNERPLLSDIRERIPANLFLGIAQTVEDMGSIFEKSFSQEQKDKMLREFINDVERRAKGEDIH